MRRNNISVNLCIYPCLRFKKTVFFPIIPLLLALTLSCGMEEYYYLPQIPEGNISVVLNDKATIALPNIDTSTGGFYYFKSFVIYYRIYVSGHWESGKIQTSNEGLGNINSYLLSDFNAIYPSTDSTSTSVNTSIGTLFRNRNYYELALEGEDIRSILDSSSINKDLEISFIQDAGRRPPAMSLNGGKLMTLNRSRGEGVFQPVPDLYFLNTTDLNKSENISSQKNADVANISGSPATRYTYVSMYIVITGMDNNYTTIYGNPTHIGILKLPD